MHDLILRGGRFLDLSRGSDCLADVAFSGGLVSGISARIDSAQVAKVQRASRPSRTLQNTGETPVPLVPLTSPHQGRAQHQIDVSIPVSI